MSFPKGLIQIMRLGHEGCLFCEIDKHATATENEKRFMYCHVADMARAVFNTGPVEFASPCREHGHIALEAAPKLGEAMGMDPKAINKVRDMLSDTRAKVIANAGGGSG
jgi:imidazole glycerol phosphate synthase subunit HisF